MALRLRRDVQKASYYVWFLGAEEARGLRGPRVINPVVPHLVERAREQEPLKVTLQVSHKGIKIVQGSAKHFIPHTAITSSIQLDDIVACVLLLYNPKTKCPLHIHAYRCDSEATAEALHQQLQVLINRLENQKRFAELESRLGITPQIHTNQSNILADQHKEKRVNRHKQAPAKRFESSLGSDAGNSTRDSECSEELVSSSISPIPKPKASLFDSLAAELRAKLNGNGPPILLPPRDYDTVHRSKGNLAAIELRRCQNKFIVGHAKIPTTLPTQLISSGGSSGIGSDLAPSPERQDTHSSSEEENWTNEHEALPPNRRNYRPEQQNRTAEIFPTTSTTHFKPDLQRARKFVDEKPQAVQPSGYHHRPVGQDRELQGKTWTAPAAREEEIRPIIMRPTDFDSRFKKVLLEKEEPDSYCENQNKDNLKFQKSEMAVVQSQERKYRKQSDNKKQHHSNTKYHPEVAEPFIKDVEKSFHNKINLDRQAYDESSDQLYDSEQEEFYRKENLTDKQKYQEACMRSEFNRVKQSKRMGFSNNSMNYIDNENRMPRETNRAAVADRHRYYHSPSNEHAQASPIDRPMHTMERHYYTNTCNQPQLKSQERNPYKQPESSPYREGINKMLKSPVVRYKSFEDGALEFNDRVGFEKVEIGSRNSYPAELDRYPIIKVRNGYELERGPVNVNRTARSSSPVSWHIKISPEDRFHDAKERFRAMECPKYRHSDLVMQQQSTQNYHVSRREPTFDERPENWSDEERALSGRRDRSRVPPMRERIRNNEGHHSNPAPYVQSGGLQNSKSLSNLAKGYRHSYAEPQAALPRNGGRVGLAAVNPF